MMHPIPGSPLTASLHLSGHGRDGGGGLAAAVRHREGHRSRCWGRGHKGVGRRQEKKMLRVQQHRRALAHIARGHHGFNASTGPGCECPE